MARESLKSVCRLIDQAKDRLPVEQSFLHDLKRSMEMEDSKHKRKPSQTYKPSSMNCIRNMYYQVMGVEPDEEPSSYCMIGICNSGSDIHERVQKAVNNMKNHGIDCEYIDVANYVASRSLPNLKVVTKSGMETKLYHDGYNMSFLCDGIIRYMNHYYILEIKTEASFKWNTRSNVDPKHFNQGIAYSLAFDIPEVLFLYINRDVLDMKSYMFIPTTDMKVDWINRINECNNYVNNKICPPVPDNLPKNTCTYCSYKNQCKKEV